MKTILLFLTVAGVGLAVGYASHRLSGTSDAESDLVAADSGLHSERAESSLRRAPHVKGSGLSAVRSSDTLESLKALPPEDLYGRLALWMVDASQEEIAEYWQHYRKQKNRANEINDLIFINWTRLDPQAAVNASANTSDEHYAWWAWACHDPAGSLAAVMSQAPVRLNNVTWGLGEFHPDWVREHWDEIPADGQRNALQGMAKWDDVGNPLEVLSFLKEKGYGFHRGIFKVLISKDPWAAYEMAERIFSIKPNAMSDMTRVSYGNGSSGWGSGRPELNHLMSALVNKDAARAMALATSNRLEDSHNPTFDQVAGMWAEQDLHGYADWVNDQAGLDHHVQAVSAVIGHLANDQNFNDAATWAVSIDDRQQRQNQLENLVRDWARSDPDSAANWLQSTNLTADEIENYQRYFPTKP